MTEPRADATAPDEEAVARVDAVLASLSTREKVGQLNQRMLGWRAVERSSSGRWRATDELRREVDRWGGLGALYGLLRADAWSGRRWGDGVEPAERLEAVAAVQEVVRAGSAAGFEALLVEEAPHGHQALGGTLLPTNLSLAATWDVDAVEEASAAVAGELAASGLDVALVSGLDVLRDGRWGRAEETFGEDPALGAAMAAAVVRGMQGADRSRTGGADRSGVAVVVKHLAAQGEATGGRNGRSALLGPRDLRQTHLRSVEAVVGAGALGVMAAYNDVDGVPCCANPWLLRTHLRDELGFDGVVMADGLAVDRLSETGLDAVGCGRTALLAGVDLSLWDEGFTTLEQSADDPAVLEAIDAACRRVLLLKARLGRLPGAASGTDDDVEGRRVPESITSVVERTRAASRRLARACLVDLGGPGSLRLPDGPVLVAGALSTESTALLGDYVPPLPREEQVSVADALRARLGDDGVVNAPSAEDLAAAPMGPGAPASTVVVVGGTSHRSYQDVFDDNGAVLVQGDGSATTATCGEGVDLVDLDLPADQRAVLRAAVERRESGGGPVVAVVVAGRPHVLTEVLDVADAVLWAGYPGPFGAEAVAKVLVDGASPVGRLPMLLPRATGVLPLHHDDRWSAEGVYQDCPSPVLAPFAAGRTGDAGGAGGLVVEPLDDGGLRVTCPTGTGGADGSPDGAVDVLLGHRGGAGVVPRLEETLAWRRSDGSTWSVDLPAAVVTTEDGRLVELWTAPGDSGAEAPARTAVPLR